MLRYRAPTTQFVVFGTGMIAPTPAARPVLLILCAAPAVTKGMAPFRKSGRGDCEKLITFPSHPPRSTSSVQRRWSDGTPPAALTFMVMSYPHPAVNAAYRV